MKREGREGRGVKGACRPCQTVHSSFDKKNVPAAYWLLIALREYEKNQNSELTSHVIISHHVIFMDLCGHITITSHHIT